MGIGGLRTYLAGADVDAAAVEYFSVHGARSVIGPALSLKKLRQPIGRSAVEGIDKLLNIGGEAS
jgi:hypothetical protein